VIFLKLLQIDDRIAYDFWRYLIRMWAYGTKFAYQYYRISVIETVNTVIHFFVLVFINPNIVYMIIIPCKQVKCKRYKSTHVVVNI